MIRRKPRFDRYSFTTVLQWSEGFYEGTNSVRRPCLDKQPCQLFSKHSGNGTYIPYLQRLTKRIINYWCVWKLLCAINSLSIGSKKRKLKMIGKFYHKLIEFWVHSNALSPTLLVLAFVSKCIYAGHSFWRSPNLYGKTRLLDAAKSLKCLMVVLDLNYLSPNKSDREKCPHIQSNPKCSQFYFIIRLNYLWVDINIRLK